MTQRLQNSQIYNEPCEDWQNKLCICFYVWTINSNWHMCQAQWVCKHPTTVAIASTCCFCWTRHIVQIESGCECRCMGHLRKKVWEGQSGSTTLDCAASSQLIWGTITRCGQEMHSRSRLTADIFSRTTNRLQKRPHGREELPENTRCFVGWHNSIPLIRRESWRFSRD